MNLRDKRVHDVGVIAEMAAERAQRVDHPSMRRAFAVRPLADRSDLEVDSLIGVFAEGDSTWQ